MITKLSQIVEEAQKKGRKRLAVAYGQDSHTLSAVYDAYKEGLVEPTQFPPSVDGIFILASLPRPRMSCIGTIAVSALLS